MINVKHMSAKDFNYIKALRDCPVEILLKIDGIPITIDFTDNLFRVRTRRSDWIYEAEQFLEYARQNPKTDWIRANNYYTLFNYLFSIRNILYREWEGRKEPVTYEVLFRPMMIKNKKSLAIMFKGTFPITDTLDSLYMINKSYPVDLLEDNLVLFDHERNVEELDYRDKVKIKTCYRGIIEISRSIEDVKTKEELHDFLRDYAMKHFPVNKFELEGYVFYFPKLGKRFKVFV